MAESKINKLIKERAKNLRFSQNDFEKEIARRRDNSDYNLYKGIVSKWFNSTQEPGKAYLLDLAEILNVNVESILQGEDIFNKKDGIRPTADSAARSQDERIIKKLFNNEEAAISIYTID